MNLIVFLCFSFFYSISIHAGEFSVAETVARIREMIFKQQKGAYLFFSERDIRVAMGQAEDFWDQIEMYDFLAVNEANVMKSQVLPYTALKGHRPEDQWAREVFRQAAHSWESLYAPLPTAFLSTTYRKECIEFFQFLKSLNVFIISDEEINQSTMELLFGPKAQCISIEESSAIDPQNYAVVLLCAGVKGKLLSKKLLSQFDRIFLIDCSGLEKAFYNWSTDIWKRWLKQKNEIKILYTSCLIPQFFQERQEEYVKCFEVLNKYNYKSKTYVAESGAYTPLSLFDEYCDHVFYANTNDTSLLNKGVNEAMACIAAFDYFKFHDDDMIVKLTGRYFFNNDTFLRLVESRPEVDAFAALTVSPVGGVFTGCFAMRYKYYKRMLEELDLEKMERESIDIEWEVGQFIQKKMSLEKASVVYLDTIGITANISNQGEMQL